MLCDMPRDSHLMGVEGVIIIVVKVLEMSLQQSMFRCEFQTFGEPERISIADFRFCCAYMDWTGFCRSSLKGLYRLQGSFMPTEALFNH